MKRLLLLVHHKENARLLHDWLMLHDYEVVLPGENGQGIDTTFDLAIVDGVALDRWWQTLQSCKLQERPQFLPILFVTVRPDLKLVTRHLWQTIDELIISPIEKTELLARIEILLRARQLSLELSQANRQLQHEITIRRQAEDRLQTVLQNTEHLYKLTSRIGSLRTPQEVLYALTLSGYYNSVSQASIIVFNQPWEEERPSDYEVLAVLHPEIPLSGEMPQFHPLKNHPFVSLMSRERPVLVHNTTLDERINDTARTTLIEIETRSVMMFPLLAGGSWYGMLSFYSEIPNRWREEDVKLIEGLVNQVAVTIDNLRLFAAEAKARQHAEMTNEAKIKFMAMISHELRTPLTSIKGFASTLLSKDIEWNREDSDRFLKIIDEESDKLKGLVDQLMDISIIQAGTLRINPKACSLNTVIDVARGQLQVITEQHTLKLDIPENLPNVFIDPQRIAQVLVNLVNNAVKHSPPATTILITAKVVMPHVQVRVIDQGSGIPPGKQELIFEAFQQLDNQPKDAKGMGLGLAICKGLIHAHGGAIWVDNRKNAAGTSIGFSLPISSTP